MTNDNREQESLMSGLVVFICLITPPFGWILLALIWFAEGRGVDTHINDPFETDMDRSMQYQIERDLAKEAEWRRKRQRWNRT